MEPKVKKQTAKSPQKNEVEKQKPKSKFTLWREKYPEGLEGTIVNMRAVLR
ncbi:MAG: hypothetical protein LBI82_03030 [Dysgonamonadaceae bacterium]|jgi:hypothetical protein|nr:hypothetical protein [Dysgonamonadaceae bacterium]